MGVFAEIGRTLLSIGLLTIILAVLLTTFEKFPVIGKLPGDLYIRKWGFRFYLPLTSSILIILILNWLVNYFKH